MDDAILKYVESQEDYFDGWKIDHRVGQGSYGCVWKLKMKGSAWHGSSCSALKVIPVPASEEIREKAWLEGLDKESARLYFEMVLNKALDEIKIMQKLAESDNVVQIYEYEIRDMYESGGYGWLLLIRMEYLVPLTRLAMDNKLALDDIVKLGIDICRALEKLYEKRIVHQDIKPDNIFYNPYTKKYKLGDFGIAKQTTRNTIQKGRPGTLSYMSPEVYIGQEASYDLDLYAIGMVLYRMLNHFRIPGLPEYPRVFTPADRDLAMMKRLKGENPPLPNYSYLIDDPANGSRAKKLAHIIQKSISADMKMRYQTAEMLRKALESV